MKTIFLTVILFFISACGSMSKLEDRQGIVPAANGDIATASDDNGNTQMRIRVKHLAPPAKIMSGANNYVVWVLPNGSQRYQNVGTLRVGSDLAGDYRTTVPYKYFQVMITPENAPGVQAPTGPAVLEKNVSM
jgi:hypothetical protein